jgi:hypothetical protein
MLTAFHHPRTKTFCLVSFLAKIREKASYNCKRLFFLQERSQKKGFCPRMVKKGHHQHKDRPYNQEKSQGAATSVEDAIIILKVLSSEN